MNTLQKEKDLQRGIMQPLNYVIRDKHRPLLYSGLPDFLWSKRTNTGKRYQMTTTYTKRP
jgi:hypothetical protein